MIRKKKRMLLFRAKFSRLVSIYATRRGAMPHTYRMSTPLLATLMDKKLGWKVKLHCLNVDTVSGHVKIQVRNQQPFWVPYVILHAGCRKETKKRWLYDTMQRLISKVAITAPYPMWEYPPCPRLTVVGIHPQLVLLYYWPEFHDGTIWGVHERVVYRLATTRTVGVVRLDEAREWFAAMGQSDVLEQFVQRKRVRPFALRG